MNRFPSNVGSTVHMLHNSICRKTQVQAVLRMTNVWTVRDTELARECRFIPLAELSTACPDGVRPGGGQPRSSAIIDVALAP